MVQIINQLNQDEVELIINNSEYVSAVVQQQTKDILTFLLETKP